MDPLPAARLRRHLPTCQRGPDPRVLLPRYRCVWRATIPLPCSAAFAWEEAGSAWTSAMLRFLPGKIIANCDH